MSSATELLFDPSTDYQVIEEFEFDEEVQRPEAIRFFTFQEQAMDLMENLLPKTGKISKGLVRKAEYEVDTFRRLYNDVVAETSSGFLQKSYVPPQTLPWVHYNNTNPLEYTEYKWAQQWAPLYTPAVGLAPNYYEKVLDSLPKSALYYTGEGGTPVYVHGKTTIGGRICLDDYTYSTTMTREDGSFRINLIKRPDTHDTARFTEYIVDPPPLAPPNPLTDHPFLSVRSKPVTIDSTDPLPDHLPTLDAIFDHGVPETNDPYKVATPYLKLYDLTLKDVPIHLWTKKFPPIVPVDISPSPTDIVFPAHDEDAPAKVLLETYKRAWSPGMSPRKWLIDQVDGGNLLARILLSKAGNVGVLAVPPPISLPEGGVIQGTAEECMPSEITSFDDFLTLGIFRPAKCAQCGAVGHSGRECPDKKIKTDYAPGYGCIPLALVTKEREDSLYLGKSPWVPGTDDTILKEYKAELVRHVYVEDQIFTKFPVSNPMTATNETRLLIVSLLDDESVAQEDQLSEINDLLKASGAVLENHVYVDKESKAFLICEHELERLQGKFDKEPRAYLTKWCSPLDGYNVCRYSGERVSEILEAQNEYDESGNITNARDAIQSKHISPSHDVSSFAISLRDIHGQFRSTDPAEDLMYLLITMLQVLPTQGPLEEVLGYVRGVSDRLNAGKADKGKVDMLLSVFGFSAVVVLMQIHRPQLIPRRSFGSKPVILRGYPRDTEDVNDAPLVDSLLSALQHTFADYPSTFRGPSVSFLRTLLNNRGSVKKQVMGVLQKQFLPVFRDRLLAVRDDVEGVVVGQELQQSFQPPIFPPKHDIAFLKPSERVAVDPEVRFKCTGNMPWLASTGVMAVIQSAQRNTEGIVRNPVSVVPPEPGIQYAPNAQEVRTRLGQKKLPESAFLKKALDETQSRVLQDYVLLVFRIVSEDTGSSNELRMYIREMRPHVTHARGSDSLLRDYFKGVLCEMFVRMSEFPTVIAQFDRNIEKDTSLKSLQSNAVESRKLVDDLAAREREEFKGRLRRMPDAQREITKNLIDRGLAPYLITKDDRESFVRELRDKIDMLEPPTDNPLAAPGEVEAPENVPEEGLHDERGVGDQGAVAENADGTELLVDQGDYGDQAARTADGEEYNDAPAYDFEEGF